MSIRTIPEAPYKRVQHARWLAEAIDAAVCIYALLAVASASTARAGTLDSILVLAGGLAGCLVVACAAYLVTTMTLARPRFRRLVRYRALLEKLAQAAATVAFVQIL